MIAQRCITGCDYLQDNAVHYIAKIIRLRISEVVMTCHNYAPVGGGVVMTVTKAR